MEAYSYFTETEGYRIALEALRKDGLNQIIHVSTNNQGCALEQLKFTAKGYISIE